MENEPGQRDAAGLFRLPHWAKQMSVFPILLSNPTDDPQINANMRDDFHRPEFLPRRLKRLQAALVTGQGNPAAVEAAIKIYKELTK